MLTPEERGKPEFSPEQIAAKSKAVIQLFVDNGIDCIDLLGNNQNGLDNLSLGLLNNDVRLEVIHGQLYLVRNSLSLVITHEHSGRFYHLSAVSYEGKPANQLTYELYDPKLTGAISFQEMDDFEPAIGRLITEALGELPLSLYIDETVPVFDLVESPMDEIPRLPRIVREYRVNLKLKMSGKPPKTIKTILGKKLNLAWTELVLIQEDGKVRLETRSSTKGEPELDVSQFLEKETESPEAKAERIAKQILGEQFGGLLIGLAAVAVTRGILPVSF